tara:strand:+ start:220893 stop:221228 length:336 start_codon:yes stop_codon:yes gene_type:complete
MNDSAITPMNTKPVIIDSVGIYLMRNGKRAQIDTVEPHGDKNVTRFNCKGCVERVFRGKVSFRGYRIWHESGLASVFESEWDILEKLSDESTHDGTAKTELKCKETTRGKE